MFAIIVNEQILARCETPADVAGYQRDFPGCIVLNVDSDFHAHEYRWTGSGLVKKTPDDYASEAQLAEARVHRAAAYPPIGDQLDALFKAGVFPPDMAAQIQAVKDKYPKGGSQ